MILKRHFIAISAFSLAGHATASTVPPKKTELQCGDKDIPAERLIYDADLIGRAAGGTKADYAPKVEDFSKSLITTAQSFVGKTRKNARDEIAEMLAIFDLRFEEEGSPTAFCAAGISYVAAKTYVLSDASKKMSVVSAQKMLGEVNHYHFFPTPSVLDLVDGSKAHRRWIPASRGKNPPLLKAGMLIVFAWGGGKYHVGLISKVIDRDNVETIEFNTRFEKSDGSDRDGGAIANRKRNLNENVYGYVSIDRPMKF